MMKIPIAGEELSDLFRFVRVIKIRESIGPRIKQQDGGEESQRPKNGARTGGRENMRFGVRHGARSAAGCHAPAERSD